MTHNSGDQTDAFPTSEPAPRRAPADDIHILRLPQVCRTTGLCRSSIYQMEAEGRFPQRVKLGARSVGWIESEVQTWLRQRIESDRPRTP
jgi:prophage regulatory protein